MASQAGPMPKITIDDIRKKVADNSRQGQYVYDLSEDEVYVIVEDVAKRWLNKDAETVIRICKSGKWEKEKKMEDVWSWLNNLVALLGKDNGTPD